MTKELFAAVQWDSLLCDQGNVTGGGTGIPWIVDNGNGCRSEALRVSSSRGPYLILQWGAKLKYSFGAWNIGLLKTHKRYFFGEGFANIMTI